MNFGPPPPRITTTSVVADSVYITLLGASYGAAWGLVTPFHPPRSKKALLETKTGQFKPARPFSSMASVGHNAAIFAAIMGVQSFSSKTLAFIRQKDDYVNQIFGCGVTYQYYVKLLGQTEKRLIMHNRIAGGCVLGGIIYGIVGP